MVLLAVHVSEHSNDTVLMSYKAGKGGAVGAIWGIGSDAELQEFFDSPPSFDCVLLFSRALFTK
jgi:hypothetical protein